MKTIFSLQTGIATLLCTAALAGLMACDADTVEQQGGKLPDKEPLENIYGRLRSSSMSDDKVRIRMTEGSGFVTSNFYYQFSKAPTSELSLDAWIDGSLLDGTRRTTSSERCCPKAIMIFLTAKRFRSRQKISILHLNASASWPRIWLRANIICR